MLQLLMVLILFVSSWGYSQEKSGLGLRLDLVGSTTTSRLLEFDYYNLGFLGSLVYPFHGNVLEISSGVIQNSDETAEVPILVGYYRKLAFLQAGLTAGVFHNTTTDETNFGIGPRAGIEFPAGNLYFLVNAEYLFIQNMKNPLLQLRVGIGK